MIHRLYVEKRPSYRQAAQALEEDLRTSLDLPQLVGLRLFVRYDVEGVSEADWPRVVDMVLAEAPVDEAHDEALPSLDDATLLAVDYLPGQYDQRADSAAQCIELVTQARPRVATATVYAFFGALAAEDLTRIRRYLINAVDSREAALEKPATLTPTIPEPVPVPVLEGFRERDADGLAALLAELGLAMTGADLAFCQEHFRGEGRDPTLTEIKLLDTYWSDHCRHTTFLTELQEVTFAEGALVEPIEAAWKRYRAIRAELYGDATDRPECLMDIAIIGMKHLRRAGKLDDLEISAEINAASLVVPVEIDGRSEEWLIMFKNETHNHPTEIEPFGGAATCLGGAIRDPLSGRSYVYQAMRVTGAADPRTPFAETLPGKLPQRKITREAAHGYSSYGNQIGLATGLVREVYHPGYVTKRLEIGAVIAAAPRGNVRREEPAAGDVIVLVGGRTGRDGIGGATGSSKAHDAQALENSAEVQKGDPVCERKLQRLFRRAEVARLIKRCNDFGAGGVSVAIGELADSLEIDLDTVPRKYEGLNGTELAISESQERMAVVLAPDDVEAFHRAAASENLESSAVARVTDSGRLRMTWRGQTTVDLSREFLDSNGVRQLQRAHVDAPDPAASPLLGRAPEDVAAHWRETLGSLAHASQKGLIEMFDSTIGAGSVLHPFGGETRSTPTEAMVALVPVLEGETTTATIMSFGFDPLVSSWSPFHGAQTAVLHSVARVVAAGGERRRTRLTLQEYFERLRDDPERWGKPLAALLGALSAQEALETAAVGGKDSMSGSFGELDVPPTLVSFAVAPVEVRRVRSPELKGPGHRLVHLALPRDALGVPRLEAAAALLDTAAAVIGSEDVLAVRAIGSGGIAVAVAEMAFGNQVGVHLHADALPATQLFQPLYGDLLLEVGDAFAAPSEAFRVIGATVPEPALRHGEAILSLAEAQSAWEAPLESVFPTRAAAASEERPVEVRFEPATFQTARAKHAVPRVVIPVFPGSNCEFDSSRAFRAAGADVERVLFRNLHPADVTASIEQLAKALEDAQILFIPGGFSAGDEPAGSGKFIAAAFRHPRLAEATMQLLKDREGLVLGICNGFQALIKLGLLPHGEIRPLSPEDPTLTHNLLQRHVSCYARTRVVSRQSPWLAQCELGEEHLIAMSHGEGRFVASAAVLRRLVSGDQIATQYVDETGKPTHALPHNPNGSFHAVEGLTSPCGRVFGKMGHSERAGPHVGLNVPGPKAQPIFAAGVRYFQV
ncbi:MAG: phosphoribosylformylglycinamidine synthase [Opitutales bacterium]